MPYYNNAQGNRNTLNVNTTILSDYSDTGKIVVSGWNDKLSIRIYEAIGKNGDGLVTYADKESFNTALTVDAQIALVRGIEKEILPQIESFDHPAKIGISNEAGDKTLSIEIDNIDHANVISLHGYSKNVSTGVVNECKHIFRTRSYGIITGNSPMQDAVLSQMIQSKFILFYQLLKRCVENFPLTHHINRYQAQITERVKQNHQNNQGGSYNNYRNNQATNPTYNSPEMENFDDLQDDLPFN